MVNYGSDKSNARKLVSFKAIRISATHIKCEGMGKAFRKKTSSNNQTTLKDLSRQLSVPNWQYKI